jgi:hypothetical protein
MDSVRLLREAKGDAKIHTRLRHWFIDYRMAKIKNANEVALEAGFDSARAKCASARIKIETMKGGGLMAGFRRVIVGKLRFKGVGLGGLRDSIDVNFLGSYPAPQDTAFELQSGWPVGKQGCECLACRVAR